LVEDRGVGGIGKADSSASLRNDKTKKRKQVKKAKAKAKASTKAKATTKAKTTTKAKAEANGFAMVIAKQRRRTLFLPD
jgi:hypothetical protein